MSVTVLLVDFENVQKVDLARLPEHMHVRIFVGAAQPKVPIELVRQGHALGGRLDWIRIEGQGRNALDFHIAFYAGEFLANGNASEVIILSLDKGFDPLIKHLAGRKLACRRITNVSELALTSTPALDANAKKVRELLKQKPKKERPHTRKALTSRISTHLVKLSTADVRGIIAQLFAAKLISEDNESLEYHF